MVFSPKNGAFGKTPHKTTTKTQQKLHLMISSAKVFSFFILTNKLFEIAPRR